MTARLGQVRMLDALEAQVGLVRFALTGDVDPAAPVPSCPDWTVHDLVVHLGTVNWWGGAVVREATPDTRTRGMSGVKRSAPAATEGAAALADWYADLATEMLGTFTDTAPDAPAWTFPGPGRADFWPRRQLHETLVHRWDLENALHGAAATTPVSEDVAVDTVDEFCTVMRPHMAAHVPPLAVTLRLRAVPHGPEGAAGGLAAGAEPAGAGALGAVEWEVPASGGVGADPTGVVEVAGPPETLALLVWGRVGADAAGLEITGDRAGLDAALEAGLST